LNFSGKAVWRGGADPEKSLRWTRRIQLDRWHWRRRWSGEEKEDHQITAFLGQRLRNVRVHSELYGCNTQIWLADPNETPASIFSTVANLPQFLWNITPLFVHSWKCYFYYFILIQMESCVPLFSQKIMHFWGLEKLFVRTYSLFALLSSTSSFF